MLSNPIASFDDKMLNCSLIAALIKKFSRDDNGLDFSYFFVAWLIEQGYTKLKITRESLDDHHDHPLIKSLTTFPFEACHLTDTVVWDLPTIQQHIENKTRDKDAISTT